MHTFIGILGQKNHDIMNRLQLFELNVNGELVANGAKPA
jgi:hypothetical protein